MNNTTDNLLREVLRWIKVRRLFISGETVVVAVSGGPDSLALLHILSGLKDQLRLGLVVAHLNHGIRGEESDADALFISELTARWGLSAIIGRADVPTYAAERKMSLEEAARESRYAFLEKAAQDVGASRVAVGHNANDQVETVLMHWLRGAGSEGLSGMAPITKRGDIWLVRPLLGISRERIEGYCFRHGLDTRLDSSNLSENMLRNRIRLRLIPQLRQYNPRIENAILRAADILAVDVDYIDEEVESLWASDLVASSEAVVTFGRDEWRNLHLSLKRRLLRRAISSLQGDLKDVSWKHIEDAIAAAQAAPAGTRIALPNGLQLQVDYDFLLVASDLPLDDCPAIEKELEIAIPGLTDLTASEWYLETQLLPAGSVSDDRLRSGGRWVAHLDADRAGERLVLRPRKPGDRIQPLGMQESKSMQDFMVDAKVPRRVRDQLPLVASANAIFWVPGWRINERAKVSSETKQVLRLHFIQEAHGD
jgi:tRNA(Ile)-lysidine synthase